MDEAYRNISVDKRFEELNVLVQLLATKLNKHRKQIEDLQHEVKQLKRKVV